jgi:hypothetical protein
MTRKEFLKIAAGPTALVAMPTAAAITATSANADGPDASAPAQIPHTFKLEKGSLRFSLTMGNGLQAKLVHTPTNTVLADGPYSYSLGPLKFAGMRLDDNSAPPNSDTFTVVGTTDTGISIQHTFALTDTSLYESIKLINTSSHPLATQFRCGFVLPVAVDTLKDYVFTAVPYRREPSGNRQQYADYKLTDILTKRRRSRLRENPEIRNEVGRFSQPRVFTEDYFSEGWAITDGKQGFLLTKYNQVDRDFAVLDHVPLAGDQVGLRWGGAGTNDDSEGWYHIAPGAARDFGVTRLTPFTGDLMQGYYTFRAEMDARGHVMPDSYDPPSHWNELYDNKLWWTGNHADPELRKKFYTLADLKYAAGQAQTYGCEALYCDPGWDTPQSSKIWGEERLGKLTDFLAMLKSEYGGLKLSLHTPLSGWTGVNADLIPGTALDREEPGPTYACGASLKYIDETVKRLTVLANAGVSFFMFDGTVWMGECRDATHGHSSPSTTREHVDAMNKIAYGVHKNNPDVLIEMHDQMLGGIGLRWVPSYYGQGKNAEGDSGWNEIWAFELMWSPMDDLVGGHSIALYYFNLAYNIPAYIHIDLRNDNEHGLMLWWNISTCRHLGVGGTHGDAGVRATQKEIIGIYRRLKPFYATGTFYGINETTHVHVDRKKTGAVVNIFNLSDQPISPEIKFDPTLYGLDPAKTYKFNGTTFAKSGNIYSETIPPIPPYAHQLIEVTLS